MQTIKIIHLKKTNFYFRCKMQNEQFIANMLEDVAWKVNLTPLKPNFLAFDNFAPSWHLNQTFFVM